MNTYLALKKLAKTNKAQNIFIASKELSGLRIFRNMTDLSNIQEFYLTWLYTYDMINRDILSDKISEKVLKDDIYEEAYLLWKKEHKDKKDGKNIEKNQKKELHLVSGKTINFPKRI
jgi:hypothetical protein